MFTADWMYSAASNKQAGRNNKQGRKMNIFSIKMVTSKGEFLKI